MNKKRFDELLKENVINSSGTDFFGYDINGRSYPIYYNNCGFDNFVNQMKDCYPSCYEKYSQGAGNELISKKGRYGFVPPKMASVASSSRFCYLALRNSGEALGGKGKVDFEHECRISGINDGTAPQMDAYFSNNIFVEVKCHEIFDSHRIMLKAKYFDYVFGEENDFGFEPELKQSESPFEIPLSKFNIEKNTAMLDIKQLICHLLGVKSHKNPNETATLVYLFFKPKAASAETAKEIDGVFEDLKNEIEIVFGGKNSPIRKFAEKNNIQLKAVAEYAEVMSPLSMENMISLFPCKNMEA